MRSFLVFTVLSLLPMTVSAGFAGGARITNLRIDPTGFGFITLDRNMDTSASCVNPGFRNALAFNANTDAGKAQLKVLLAAKLSGSSVNVFGGGNCSFYTNTIEDLGDFIILD